MKFLAWHGAAENSEANQSFSSMEEKFSSPP